MTTRARRGFIERARLDSTLKHRLIFDHKPSLFLWNLITHLMQYGCLEDGRDPVESILEASKFFMEESHYGLV